MDGKVPPCATGHSSQKLGVQDMAGSFKKLKNETEGCVMHAKIINPVTSESDYLA